MASYDDHAAGVAEDYRDALEGLTMNSRVEINNLTLIARENTECAHAISEVLQDHIKKVSPPRKLPALYLLDSIVKNVGTPYTIYFGRGLYTTYMEAYASVDNNTRRKMEEMLKTWREPVPGSIDPRPVFQPDATRPIENALIQARTSAMQASRELVRNEQQLLRGGKALPPGMYRDTATPPGARPGPPPSAGPYGQPGPGQFPGINGNVYGDQGPAKQSYPMHPAQVVARLTPQPPPSAPAAIPFQPPAQPPHTVPGPQPGMLSIASLNQDIERLITLAKAAWTQNIHDTSMQAKLKALLDLQELLKSQNLQADKLVLVKNQIDALSVNMAGHKTQIATPTPPGAGLGGLPAHASYRPPPVSQPVATPIAPPASAPPAVSLDSLLGKGALAALLSRGSATPQASSAYPAPALLLSPLQQSIPFPRPPAAASTPATPDPMALLGALRQKGLLPAVGQAPSATSTMTMLAPTPVSLTSGVPGVISSSPHPGLGGGPGPGPAAREPLQEIRTDIQWRAASLKTYRPHLLPLLHDDLGPPCTQCGRRFRTDEEGRTRKTRHMDGHFRVHQRIAEVEKRGQHRSWYLDQMDWVRTRETDTDLAPHDGPDQPGSTGGGTSGPAGAQKAAAPPVAWLPVPDAGSGASGVCPICQERFEQKWLDEAQEWVWMDAVRIGGRIYHASCHAEAARDGDPLYAPAAAAGYEVRGTPEPVGVLGKRKAEDEHAWRGKGRAEGLPY